MTDQYHLDPFLLQTDDLLVERQPPHAPADNGGYVSLIAGLSSAPLVILEELECTLHCLGALVSIDEMQIVELIF